MEFVAKPMKTGQKEFKRWLSYREANTVQKKIVIKLVHLLKRMV